MSTMAATEVAAITTEMRDFSVEDTASKHRKQRKELQGKIQALKRNAPKNDKKKRKEVLEEIARMESELEQRQTLELNEINGSAEEKKEEMGVVHGDESANFPKEIPDIESQKRVTKAQRRRDKKSREAKQREADVLAFQENNRNGPKTIETDTINGILKGRQLMLHFIPSDGDCLYNAIRHQLQQRALTSYSVAELRQLTSGYIRDNKADLIFYMTNPSTGDLLTDDEFNVYCENVHKTAAWGGEIELKALSSILKTPIEVLQATGSPTLHGSDAFTNPKLIITYHRHLFALGEHYNSTKPMAEDIAVEEMATMATQLARD